MSFTVWASFFPVWSFKFKALGSQVEVGKGERFGLRVVGSHFGLFGFKV